LQAHPKRGPFRLQSVKNSSEVEIVNSKGKKALAFKPEQFSLETGELIFNMDDISTYTLLCYVGPKAFVLQVATARRRATLQKSDNDPFTLSRDSDNQKMIHIANTDGVFHSFDLLKTPRPSDEDWIPVGQQGSSSLKHRVSFCQNFTRKSTSTTSATNRFSPLADTGGSTQSHGKEVVSVKVAGKSEGKKTANNKRSTSAKGTTGNDMASLNSNEAASGSGNSSSQEMSDQDTEEDSHSKSEDEDMEEVSQEKEEDLEPNREVNNVDSIGNLVPVTREPVVIHITPHTPEWLEEDSDGEAACSGDEKSPPKKNLKDIAPTPSIATTLSTTACSSLSHNTDPTLVIDPSSGQHLITVEIQLQPGKEHLEVLLEETKRFLDYVQELYSTAKFVSRGLDANNKPFPDLTSSKNKHWPKKFAMAQNWFQVSAGFVFSQPPITEKQLQACLEMRRNRFRSNDAEVKRKKSTKGNDKEDKWPTAVYVTMNLFSAILT